MKAALQTMCINDEIKIHGAYEAFRKAADIGYTDLEISGHIDLTDEFLEQTEKAKKDFGLNICALSCEYNGPFEVASFFPGQKALRLTDNYDETVKTAKAFNSSILRFAGIPVEAFKNEGDMREYFKVTEEYAQRLKKEGIILCSHNHESEFFKISGKTVFEWALELCSDLQFEMDIFGVQMSGMNPLDFLEMAKNRVPLIHFSDIAIALGNGPRLTLDMIKRVPLGMGNFNVSAIVKKAQECGTQYFIMEASEVPGLNPYEAMKNAKVNYDKYCM